jgi:hypothetical protein
MNAICAIWESKLLEKKNIPQFTLENFYFQMLEKQLLYEKSTIFSRRLSERDCVQTGTCFQYWSFSFRFP